MENLTDRQTDRQTDKINVVITILLMGHQFVWQKNM